MCVVVVVVAVDIDYLSLTYLVWIVHIGDRGYPGGIVVVVVAKEAE